MFRRIAALFLLYFGMHATAFADTWHRADTHHFIIYSDGRAGQLEDFAHEVERFDSLLRLLFSKPAAENPNRLVIYLLEDANEVDRLHGPRNTGVAGFYARRTEGSFAVGNRRETRQKGRLSGKRVLFHEYAHHFMFQNLAMPAPAWFVEGFAEFVATSEFKRNGEWTFGKPALHRVGEVEYFGSIPIRELLTERPKGGGDGNAFYGWSWALTHMLYSQEMGRGRLVTQYLNRMNRGEDPLVAAEAVFGDLDVLDRQLRQYVNRSIEWNRSPNAIAYKDDISVRTLSDMESETVKLGLHRLSGYEPDNTHANLRELTARPGAGAQAWYELAQMEFRLAHNDEQENPYDFRAANAAVDQALALDPDHALANVLKGNILLEPFDHEDDADPALWDQARIYFEKGMAAEPSHPWPQFAFANSFMREGVRDPRGSAALLAAYQQAPESGELRFAYALDLAQRGQLRRAISTLQVIANNPHGGSGAEEAIERIRALMNGASGAPTIAPLDDEETGEGEEEGDMEEESAE